MRYRRIAVVILVTVMAAVTGEAVAQEVIKLDFQETGCFALLHGLPDSG